MEILSLKYEFYSKRIYIFPKFRKVNIVFKRFKSFPTLILTFSSKQDYPGRGLMFSASKMSVANLFQ